VFHFFNFCKVFLSFCSIYSEKAVRIRKLKHILCVQKECRRRKNQQLTQVQMFIHNKFNLNMFRAPLCPLSGEHQSNTSIHTVRSARVPAPHNRSQHIQANTTPGLIESVLLTMGIMMPETS